MPIRFYTYFKIGFQYYLADLCYYERSSYCCSLGIPRSKSLFISVFSLTMGTLSFAVITWRNSLVLHSIEKTTSPIIHVMPPVTMFVLVHQTQSYIQGRYPAIAEVEKLEFCQRHYLDIYLLQQYGKWAIITLSPFAEENKLPKAASPLSHTRRRRIARVFWVDSSTNSLMHGCK